MASFKKISISVLLVCLLISSLYALRVAPKEVKPVEKDGVIYSAPLHVDIRGIDKDLSGGSNQQYCGYILARNAKTKRIKWLTQVYVVERESCDYEVEDELAVFITEIKLDGDNLIIKNEKNQTFLLNIKTLEVTREPSNSKFIEIDSKIIKGVIIPKEYFSNTRKAPVSGVSGYWTIEKFDFEDLDNRLEKYLKEEAKLENWNKKLPDKFRNYKRQYAGVIVDGSKRILINFFCENFEYWKYDYVKITDGGDCYFHVEYDIKSHKFFNLWINGEA